MTSTVIGTTSANIPGDAPQSPPVRHAAKKDHLVFLPIFIRFYPKFGPGVHSFLEFVCRIRCY